MLVKVVIDWDATEGYKVGDIVDLSSPEVLLREGKVIPVENVVDAIGASEESIPASGTIEDIQEQVKPEKVTMKGKK